MKPVYVKGILAGVAGGVAIAAVLVLQAAINMLAMPPLYSSGSYPFDPGLASMFSVAFAILSYGLYGVLLLLTGILAVWLARTVLHEYSEALISSGISGVVASIIWVVTNTVLSVITLLFVFPSVMDVAKLPGQPLLSLIGIAVVTDLCCCGPIFIVIATILALIGGGACGLIVVKN